MSISIINIPMNGVVTIWTSNIFDLLAWDEVNIWPKFHENPSSCPRNMEGTLNKCSNLWPSGMTLTLKRYGRDICSAHHLDEVNNWLKLAINKDVLEMLSGHKTRLKHTSRTFKLALTLNQYGRDMCSSHSKCNFIFIHIE